jgi:hypothetical protein
MTRASALTAGARIATSTSTRCARRLVETSFTPRVVIIGAKHHPARG